MFGFCAYNEVLQSSTFRFGESLSEVFHLHGPLWLVCWRGRVQPLLSSS